MEHIHEASAATVLQCTCHALIFAHPPCSCLPPRPAAAPTWLEDQRAHQGQVLLILVAAVEGLDAREGDAGVCLKQPGGALEGVRVGRGPQVVVGLTAGSTGAAASTTQPVRC